MSQPDKKSSKTVNPDLVTEVTHDLKTPISAIRGFLELMEYVGPFNEHQQQLSERILSALDHMQELIVDFEDVAHLDSGTRVKMETTDFLVLCRETVEIMRGLAEKQQVTIDLDLPEDAIVLVCDPSLIRRVMMNLLANAIKYNNPHGMVRLSLSVEPAQVQVSVWDNGVGIAETEQDQVFDRFYRARSTRDRKISGSGLGLSIARMIVEQHDGRIWLESVPGQGSTFSFTLPLVGKDA